MKLAARLGTAELGMTEPGDEDFRRPFAAWRMFRRHVGEARRRARLYPVFRAWMKACSSLVVDRFRRQPPIPSDFDEISYLLLYPDIARTVAAGGLSSGYEHWVRYGQHEGRLAHFIGSRKPKPNTTARVQPRPNIPADFDEDAYLFFNPDVSAAVDNGWFASGYAHWSKAGRAEERGGGVWDPLPERSGFGSLLESRSHGVNLYGFLSTPSGLGQIARSCAKALTSACIPFRSIDVPDWQNHEAPRTRPEFTPYRINLIQQNIDMLPRFGRAYGSELLNGCYNIGYWLWELPSARSDWRHLYGYVDEIWVASEFCRHAFQQAIRLPVTRVPPVVEGLEKLIEYSRDHFGFPRDVFVFGYIFDVSSHMERKNPLCLIEAFRREFGGSRDVMLCLKFFNGVYDTANVHALEEAVSGAPNIRIFSGLMSGGEIASLQNAMDCLVSPHRCEGFGYNLAEAMYLGKPAIATRYSSNLDFMHDDNSYLIDCALTPIPHDIGPYRQGSVWADPSVEHLRRLMRSVFEDSDARQAKARRGAETIRMHYSAAAVGEVMARRFSELKVAENKPPRTLVRSRSANRPPSFFHPDTPANAAEEIRSWKSRPAISIVTPVYDVAGRHLRSCIESVRSQYYPCWELCLCDDGSTRRDTLDVLESYRGLDPRIKIVRLEPNQGIAAASNRAAEISTGAYLAMLDDDDELAPNALFEIAAAIREYPDIDLLYTDEDKIDESGAFVDHYCKPDWSPEHLLSVNYILHMLVVRKDVFYAVGQFRSEFSGAQDYDLALRVAGCARRIHHVARILYHWRKVTGSAAAGVDAKPAALDAGKRALEDHVRHSATNAYVEPGLLPGLFRVRHCIPEPPLASICILASGRATKVEGRGVINLLENFVKSIAEKTEYPNYEIVAVDDGNLPESTLRALKGIDFRRVSAPVNRPFNFSKKVNFAWRQARGRHIVLLNDDMEVVSGEWLRAMMELLQQEAVGVVGARLLFPDQRIQHVGVVLGVGEGAAHVYHGFPSATVGYNAFTHVVRNYSAVTAAAMATRREVLESTGGFDEELAVDYNDIDFCLKAIQAGYRVVYTPYAELLHFEGASLGRKEQNSKEVGLFLKRWPSWVASDPYYNLNLTRTALDFSLDSFDDEFACEPTSTYN